MTRLLKVSVDVVPADSLKPRVRAQAEDEAIPLGPAARYFDASHAFV